MHRSRLLARTAATVVTGLTLALTPALSAGAVTGVGDRSDQVAPGPPR